MAITVVAPDRQRSIGTLNACLRGELSAADTFDQTIARFGSDAPAELLSAVVSHRRRAVKLADRIRDLGGTPAVESGLWRSFTRLVEGRPRTFGRSSALSALQEGEDRGVTQYRERLAGLDPQSRRLVEAEILPEQLRSHDTIRSLSRAAG